MKVNIKLCSGTACYILGGADFLAFKEIFSEKELEKINLKISNCLGYCNNEDSKSPYVVINNKVYDNMNTEKLVSLVQSIIKKIG